MSEAIAHWVDSAHQAADYVRTMTVLDDNDNPIDLTDYEVQVQWRLKAEDEAAVSLTSDEGGGIVVTAASGIIEVTVPQATLQTIPGGNYTYDVVLKSSADSYTVLVVVSVYLEKRSTRWVD